MFWRDLVRIFSNHPHLIQRLSETPPIRAAARMVVYWFNEAKYKGQDSIDKFKTERSDPAKSGFFDRFKDALKDEMKNAESENGSKSHTNSYKNHTRRPFSETNKSTRKGWDNGGNRQGKP
ncbi:hypothetical protein ACF0H5_011908 [Mactra antiquata]